MIHRGGAPKQQQQQQQQQQQLVRYEDGAGTAAMVEEEEKGLLLCLIARYLRAQGMSASFAAISEEMANRERVIPGVLGWDGVMRPARVEDFLGRFRALPVDLLGRMITSRTFLEATASPGTVVVVAGDEMGSDSLISQRKLLRELREQEEKLEVEVSRQRQYMKRCLFQEQKTKTTTKTDESNGKKGSSSSSLESAKGTELKNQLEIVRDKIKIIRPKVFSRLDQASKRRGFPGHPSPFFQMLESCAITPTITPNLSHLAIKSTSVLKKITGHKECSYCVTSDPSGKWIVTGADDNLLKLWNSRTGNLHAVLRGHQSVICDIAIDPSGTFIASVSDTVIRFWDLKTSKPLHIFTGNKKPITNICFGPIGNDMESLLLSCSEDGTCCIWETSLVFGKAHKTGRKVSNTANLPIALPHFTSATRPKNGAESSQSETNTLSPTTVNWASIRPCGKFAVTACDDGVCRVWAISREIPSFGSKNSHVAPSVENLLNTLYIDGSDRLVCYLRGHHDSVSSVSWSGLGDRIVSMSEKDGTARVWFWHEIDETSSLNPGRIVSTNPALTGAMWNVPHCRVLSSTSRLATLSSGARKSATTGRKLDQTLAGTSIAVPTKVNKNPVPTPSMDATIWSRDDQFVITAQAKKPKNAQQPEFWDQQVRVWDSRSGTLLHILRGHRHMVTKLIAHPSFNNIVVSGGLDGLILFWDIIVGAELMRLDIVASIGLPLVLDAKFLGDGVSGAANLVVTDTMGRLILIGTGDASQFAAAPPSQFFANEEAEFVFGDDIAAIDAASHQPLYKLPRVPVCDIDGVPYPIQPIPIRQGEGCFLPLDEQYQMSQLQVEENRKQRIPMVRALETVLNGQENQRRLELMETHLALDALIEVARQKDKREDLSVSIVPAPKPKPKAPLPPRANLEENNDQTSAPGPRRPPQRPPPMLACERDLLQEQQQGDEDAADNDSRRLPSDTRMDEEEERLQPQQDRGTTRSSRLEVNDSARHSRRAAARRAQERFTRLYEYEYGLNDAGDAIDPSGSAVPTRGTRSSRRRNGSAISRSRTRGREEDGSFASSSIQSEDDDDDDDNDIDLVEEQTNDSDFDQDDYFGGHLHQDSTNGRYSMRSRNRSYQFSNSRYTDTIIIRESSKVSKSTRSDIDVSLLDLRMRCRFDRDWLLKPSIQVGDSYVPQVGDLSVYCTQAHGDFLKTLLPEEDGNKEGVSLILPPSLYDFAKEKGWPILLSRIENVDYQFPSSQAMSKSKEDIASVLPIFCVVFVRIIGLPSTSMREDETSRGTSSSPTQTITDAGDGDLTALPGPKRQFVPLAPDSEEELISKIFVVKMYSHKGPEFFILKNVYEIGMQTTWRVGDRVRSIFGDAFFDGTVEQIDDTDHESFPGSPFDSLLIKWDNDSSISRASPWSCQRIGTGPANGQLPRGSSSAPWDAAVIRSRAPPVPTNGNVSDPFAAEMESEFAQDLEAQKNLGLHLNSLWRKGPNRSIFKKGTDNEAIIPVNITPNLIMKRLQLQKFYRTWKAIDFDIRLLGTNFFLYHSYTHEHAAPITEFVNEALELLAQARAGELHEKQPSNGTLLEKPSGKPVRHSRGRSSTNSGEAYTDHVQNMRRSRRLAGADLSSPLSTHRNTASRRGDKMVELSQLVRMAISLLSDLGRIDVYGVFGSPVKEEEAPGYSEIVSEPMDLSTIREKVENGSYGAATNDTDGAQTMSSRLRRRATQNHLSLAQGISFFKELLRDIKTMASNAKLYNGEDSEIAQLGEELLKLSRERIRHFAYSSLGIENWEDQEAFTPLTTSSSPTIVRVPRALLKENVTARTQTQPTKEVPVEAKDTTPSPPLPSSQPKQASSNPTRKGTRGRGRSTFESKEDLDADEDENEENGDDDGYVDAPIPKRARTTKSNRHPPPRRSSRAPQKNRTYGNDEDNEVEESEAESEEEDDNDDEEVGTDDIAESEDEDLDESNEGNSNSYRTRPRRSSRVRRTKAPTPAAQQTPTTSSRRPRRSSKRLERHRSYREESSENDIDDVYT